jgi:hypothetical protein
LNSKALLLGWFWRKWFSNSKKTKILEIMTPKEYVVGYVCKQLAEKGMLATTALRNT